MAISSKVFIDPNLTYDANSRNLRLNKNNSSKQLITNQNKDFQKNEFKLNRIQISIDGKNLRKRNYQQKRKLEDLDSFKPSQQVQQIDYTNQDVSEVVRNALKSTKHDSPIILINHQSELTLPETERKSDQHYSSLDYSQNMNIVNITDLPNLEKILDEILSIYTRFYTKMPQEQKQETSENQDQHKRLSKYILSLKSFSADVIQNSESLMDNINYFERKIHLLQEGEEQMMVFYNFSKRYAKLKTETSLKTDEEILNKWTDINDFSEKFNFQIKECIKNSYALYKFNYQFANHIKQIDQATSSGADDAIQKFDQVLRLSVSLIEKKQEIENSINSLKKNLQEIKIISYHVDSSLMQIRSILDGFKYDTQSLPDLNTSKNLGSEKDQDQKKEEIKERGKIYFVMSLLIFSGILF